MQTAEENETDQQNNTGTHYKCDGCGSDMKFAPGTFSQKCLHCGHTVKLEKTTDTVREMDFADALRSATEDQQTEEVKTRKCPSCGAEIIIADNIVSSQCPYCETSMIDGTESHNSIKPQSLLPFKVTDKEGKKLFQDWIGGRWFAPGKLKELCKLKDGLKGVYVPYWTYDCHAETSYTGQRGEDYWETEHYTTVENGKTVSKTRQVRKTRWYPASGQVANNFDDVLVLASNSFPRKLAEELEPWDLHELNSYDTAFLSGFETEKYSVNLKEGFVHAQQIMEDPIRKTICNDIGGDHQRIHSMHSKYSKITFKHLLLPVWISSYKFDSKLYQIMINARTGEVQGQRPWSWIKITLFVLAILALLGGIVYGFTRSSGSTHNSGHFRVPTESHQPPRIPDGSFSR